MSNRVEAYYNHDPDQPIIVTTPEEMDQLIDKLLLEPFKNSIAALYNSAHPVNALGFPDHELYVGVNAETKVGGLAYMGHADGVDGNWYSKGNVSQYDEVYYCYMGEGTDFPRDSEISLDLIRQAAKEFLENGGQRPTCVAWQARVVPDMTDEV